MSVNGGSKLAVEQATAMKVFASSVRKSSLTTLAIATLMTLGAPRAVDARPAGYYAGGGYHGGAWVGYRPGWGGAYYRPGWGAWGAYRAPYYGYYGFGLAAGAAIGWSIANPWWPAPAWSAPWYGYPAAYYPYAGVALAAPLVEQVYVEQPQVAAAEPAHPKSPGHWYYCTAPAGYYPYVNTCTRPWIAVTPQPAPGQADGDASQP